MGSPEGSPEQQPKECMLEGLEAQASPMTYAHAVQIVKEESDITGEEQSCERCGGEALALKYMGRIGGFALNTDNPPTEDCPMRNVTSL
jgi:hypothetical protein